MSGVAKKVLLCVGIVLCACGIGLFCVFGIPAIRVHVQEKYIYNQTLGSMIEIPDTNYSVCRTEVTQELYLLIMGENPSYCNKDRVKKWKQLPVECICWFDAICFCNRLSVHLGLSPVFAVNGETDVDKWDYIPHRGDTLYGDVTMVEGANGFRLPTQNEWEYAAFGGEDYLFYAGSNDVDEVSWYLGNSNGSSHPVASKKPNGYGIYDMSGNVWEWCFDQYDEITKTTPLLGPDTTPFLEDWHVIRGGCCMGNGILATACSITYRSYSTQTEVSSYVGFRICCSLE